MLVKVDDDNEEAYSDSVHSDSSMLRVESTVLRGFITLSTEGNEQAY